MIDISLPKRLALPIHHMEHVTSRLRKNGDFYELDGEPIRRTVGRPRVGRDPFEALWDLRESGRELLGGELPDDTYPDEPIRRTVGKTCAR